MLIMTIVHWVNAWIHARNKLDNSISLYDQDKAKWRTCELTITRWRNNKGPFTFPGDSTITCK